MSAVDTRKPLQTQATQRVYKPTNQAPGPDGFGPPHVGSANIAPAGKGGHCIAYQLLAGHRLSFAFTVDASNKLADYFEFAKSLNKTTDQLMNATISKDNTGANPIDSYEGRDTVTNQPFGWYAAKEYEPGGRTHGLEHGVYWLNIDTPDGKACEIPLWHQGSN